MTQNKSVEELAKELRTVSNMINMGEKIPWARETTLMDEAADMLEELSQTLQEREREIVREAIRLSDEAERGNETEFNEWRAFKGFRNGLHDWVKEKGITNPNKD